MYILIASLKTVILKAIIRRFLFFFVLLGRDDADTGLSGQ